MVQIVSTARMVRRMVIAEILLMIIVVSSQKDVVEATPIRQVHRFLLALKGVTVTQDKSLLRAAVGQSGSDLHNILREHQAFDQWFFCYLRLPSPMQHLCRHARGLSDTYEEYNRLDPDAHGIFNQVPLHDPQPLLLLRTYTQDIELVQPLKFDALPTLLIGPKLSQPSHFIRRFNLVCPIPELNIVLVGSQCGNVVAITLTQLLDPNGLRDPFFTFRQETVLPLPEHLEKHKHGLDSMCPLLGLAVSPVQGSINHPDRELAGRRWRVIMHYYDHSIITYELGWKSREILRFGNGDCVAD